MPVVNVKSARFQTRSFDELLIELLRFCSHRNSRAVLAGVDVEQNFNRFPGGFYRFAKLSNRFFMIGRDGKMHTRIFLEERDASMDVRSDDVVRQQNIRHADFGEHFRFGERGAFVFGDAAF